ncbi:Survival motor neuron-like protein 1, partial [Colletotrichum shisoi]
RRLELGIMADNAMEMTHAEMWDDSALIDSWNEALDEYKASGPLPSHERRWFPLTLDAQPHAVDQPEIVPGTAGASKTEGAGNSTEVQNDSSNVPIAEAVSGHGGDGLGPATMGPQSLLGTGIAVQDERLKKLLMSWYYAGYYTGLYEGQQQQQQQQQQQA